MLVRLFLILIVSISFAKAEEVCMYIDKGGVIKTVNNKTKVPSEYRSIAQCKDIDKGNYLAKPEEIDLGKSIRREEINSPVGKITLRWSRSLEGLFGRTPVRAMVESAKTVSHVIRSSAFPSSIQNMNLNWNVVFIDDNLPDNQIPTQLITNCHPGWMTPPANIYIVAQRIAAGCGGERSTQSDADRMLTEVLVHEMGHALEFYMLPQNNPSDRMRAEGFATWFEIYASQFSSLMNQREITKRTALSAAYAIKSSPQSFSFSGSGADYARASMYFSAIESRLGLRGIISLYEQINNGSASIFEASSKKLGINQEQLDKEVLKFIEKNTR